MLASISFWRPANCSASSCLDHRRIDAQQGGQRAHIDDVLEQLALARQLRRRRCTCAVSGTPTHGDVVAELRRRQRLGGVVEQVAAGLDLGDVAVPGLRVHGDHQVDPAAAAQMPGLGDPHLVPGRQALDVGGEDVARRHRHAHPQDRLGEHAVGAGRARAVHIGELDDEVVDRRGLHRPASTLHRDWHAAPAWVISRVNAACPRRPVGQRSAQRPQCRQTSSSLTITRPVLQRAGDIEVLVEVRAPAPSGGCAGRPPRSSSVKVMQSIGQMSTQASHSMHSVVGEHRLDVAVQAALRPPCSRVSRSNPSSTSILTSFSATALSRSGTLVAAVVGDVVVVAPLVDAHLLADERDVRRRAVGARPRPGRSWSMETAASWPWATAQMMFFGPERRVAAEEDVRDRSTAW